MTSTNVYRLSRATCKLTNPAPRHDHSARWRLLAGILLLLAISPANGATIGTTTIAGRYEDPVAAARALAARFAAQSASEDAEHVGALLRAPDGQLVATHGVGRSGVDRVQFRIPVPSGFEIVAFWHTHGAHGVGRDLFSPRDTELVASTGKPLYLITPSGVLKVLEPGAVRGASPRLARSLLRAPRGSQPGTVIGRVARGSGAAVGGG